MADLENGGHLYVCGGTTMGSDVMEVVRITLQCVFIIILTSTCFHVYSTDTYCRSIALDQDDVTSFLSRHTLL